MLFLSRRFILFGVSVLRWFLFRRCRLLFVWIVKLWRVLYATLYRKCIWISVHFVSVAFRISFRCNALAWRNANDDQNMNFVLFLVADANVIHTWLLLLLSMPFAVIRRGCAYADATSSECVTRETNGMRRVKNKQSDRERAKIFHWIGFEVSSRDKLPWRLYAITDYPPLSARTQSETPNFFLFGIINSVK